MIESLRKTILLSVVGSLLLSGLICAQEKNALFRVGTGLGIFQVPQEIDFKAGGYAGDLFVDMSAGHDLLNFRLGINSYQSKLDFTASSLHWEHVLTTNSIYLTYYYSIRILQDLEAFGLAGLAYMDSTLQNNQIPEDTKAHGTGTLLGAGCFYHMSDWAFGGQILTFSRSDQFGNAKVAVGSNQLYFIAAYRL